MGVVAFGGQDALDLAIRAVFDHRLLGVEIHRPALLPPDPHSLIQLVQSVQMRRQLGVFGADAGIAIGDDGRHRVVGQPGVRADHRLGKARANDSARGVKGHFAHQAQPVHLRIQRTQPIG